MLGAVPALAEQGREQRRGCVEDLAPVRGCNEPASQFPAPCSSCCCKPPTDAMGRLGGGRCRPGGRKRTQPLVGCRCRRDRNAAINILFNWTREAKTGLVPLPFRKSTPKGTDAEHPRALRYKYKVKDATAPHPRRLQRTLAPLAQPFGALRAACRGLQAAAAVLLANLPMQPAAPAAVAAGGGVPAAAAA